MMTHRPKARSPCSVILALSSTMTLCRQMVNSSSTMSRDSPIFFQILARLEKVMEQFPSTENRDKNDGRCRGRSLINSNFDIILGNKNVMDAFQ